MIRPKIKDIIVKTADTFNDALDPNYILIILNEFINQMSKTEIVAQQDIIVNNFNKTMKSLEIVTIKIDDDHIWVQEPLTYNESIINNGFLKRSIHLLKTGKRLNKKLKYEQINTQSNTTLPITVEVVNDVYDDIKDLNKRALFDATVLEAVIRKAIDKVLHL